MTAPSPEYTALHDAWQWGGHGTHWGVICLATGQQVA